MFTIKSQINTNLRLDIWKRRFLKITVEVSKHLQSLSGMFQWQNASNKKKKKKKQQKKKKKKNIYIYIYARDHFELERSPDPKHLYFYKGGHFCDFLLAYLSETGDKTISSRKHAYVILTPLNPTLYRKTEVYRGIHYFFLILLKTDCLYSLEPPRRGGSNEYPQSMLWAEIWKISEFFYLKKYQFLVIKLSIFEWACGKIVSIWMGVFS